MKKSNWKSTVGVGVAAMTICMSAMTTLAYDDGDVPTIDKTEGGVVKTEITKTLNLAEGTLIPGATFEFTVTSITEGAATVEMPKISYSSADALGTAENGLHRVMKTGDVTFGTFAHAGEFIYTVTETANTYVGTEHEKVTYSTETYTMHVYVKNDEQGGTYISNITAANSKGEKVEDMGFENTYRKNNAALDITKKVEGEYGDKTKDFDFEIQFIKSPTAEESDYETLTGKIGNETVDLSLDEKNTFQLKHGETLEITGLPVGTRYVVKEEGETGYTGAVTVTANNVQIAANQGASGQSVITTNGTDTNYVGEAGNKVTFTNTYKNVPITGVVMNNLPFVMMIAAAAVLMVLGVFAKRFKLDK